MAVVQISKIQIRRGQKNQGTGLPQLASGEMAWAIDTQELFIGNGAVGEGSPAVGNTKIITQRDNLLDLVNQYKYKSDNPLIFTPVSRNLKQRLDERVTNASYGILPNGDNMANALQFAINNLFITNKITGLDSRVTLEFLPGRYVIEKTIYIPSYVSIIGAGKDKTIFEYTGSSGPAFRFVNDISTINTQHYSFGLPSPNQSGTYNQQPKFINLSNFSIKTANTDVTAFLMESVRDSAFVDISILGNYDWNEGADSTTFNPESSSAFNLKALSSLITCKNNIFKNVDICRFIGCVYSDFDISNNTWDNCYFKESKFGIRFGEIPSSVVGNRYGARYNIIKNSFFYDIKEEGLYIEKGFGNLSNNNLYTDVGNDGAGNSVSANGTSVIKFLQQGNVSSDDIFDRAFNKTYVEGAVPPDQSTGLANTFVYKYYPELEGPAYFKNNAANVINVARNTTSFTNLFRIPVSDNSNVTVKYHISMPNGNQMRRGWLCLAVDYDNNSVSITDEYDYIGTSGQDINISFSAVFDTVNSCINIKYVNSNTAYDSILTYVYSVLS